MEIKLMITIYSRKFPPPESSPPDFGPKVQNLKLPESSPPHFGGLPGHFFPEMRVFEHPRGAILDMHFS